MSVDVLLGLQWGDEGKGKIADLIANKYDVIARFQGGPNAGHTLVIDDKKYVLHTIPSGIIHPGTQNLIGNGVVIDPITLKKEIETLESSGIEVKSRLIISDKAHLILPGHRALDAAYENFKGGEKIGSTLKGIGPTYQDKASREGLRVGEVFEPEFEERLSSIHQRHKRILDDMNYQDSISYDEWREAVEFLKKLKIDQTEYWLNQKIKEGKNILAEGAQGTLLDIDYGTYPYVTSSNTISAAACTGLGISPSAINRVYGILKAYTTRVGSGPFPTELLNETGEALRKAGNEFGATTGRPRRCGWLDISALKYAVMINGVTDLILTKVDVLSDMDEIKVGKAYRFKGKQVNYAETELSENGEARKNEIDYDSFPTWKQNCAQLDSWEDIPHELKKYLNYIEKELDVDFSIVSVGPARKETIFKKGMVMK